MNAPLQVVIATNLLNIGGAERTVQTLALYLDKNQFSVTVLCLLAGGPRANLLQEKGVRVLVGDGTLDKIRELLPNPTVDILHFHRSGQHELDLHNQVVNYLRPKKIMETNIFAFPDPTLAFDLQIYKSAMMLAERVWRGARMPADTVLKQRVIYNPVTVDYFDQFKITAGEREARRRALGIEAGDIVLGRNGRNDTVKWGDLITSALPHILALDPRIKILFQTVPTARLRWLETKRFFDGRVIVLPESATESDIAETYQLLDIYVHTTRRGEAFGNSLNEAMVWSLPIIVENTPQWDNGQLEQVEHGVTGWVVRSTGGLLGAIRDLVGNSHRRADFGAAGRAKVERCFGVRRSVAQYELAYQQLMGLVSKETVKQEIYPAAADLLTFHERYSALKRLDFAHTPTPLIELKRIITYWRWRVIDSLVSRGYYHLK